MDTPFPTKTADYTFGSAKDAFEKSKDQFEKINATAVKGFDELAALTKGNVEAVFASANVAIKGAEEIGRAWYAYTQAVSEQGATVARSMLSAKTFREVVDLQAGYAKSTFDGLVAESTKISELGLKVTNEALAPITARVNVAVEKFSKPLAA